MVHKICFHVVSWSIQFEFVSNFYELMYVLDNIVFVDCYFDFLCKDGAIQDFVHNVLHQSLSKIVDKALPL